MDLILKGLFLSYLLMFCHSQILDIKEKNVCRDKRNPSHFVCCPGWKRQGNNCSVPLCEGPQSCSVNEMCVNPGFCLCKPGFFGANCETSCPPQFWGSECKKVCSCHPHGQCDPVTGQCTCNSNRWGPNCQETCKCGNNAACDPLTGQCICKPGWWGLNCKQQCKCSLDSSKCDLITGKCNCSPGFWGANCALKCMCVHSSCHQETGICHCKPGTWGPSCERSCSCQNGNCDPRSGECLCEPGYKSPTCSEPCQAGFYGSGCKMKCGYCKHHKPCDPKTGSCVACELGWNGTLCNQLCPAGRYGENCNGVCRCRGSEVCNRKTGTCLHCNPGWSGPRCDSPCPAGSYGNLCRFQCQPCYHGSCDSVTGHCICDSGYQGDSCNTTCPVGFHGQNCSSPCLCRSGTCHPVTGVCDAALGRHEVLIIAILVPLLLVLLAVICCCCCCGSNLNDTKDRSAISDAGPMTRMKHHVICVIANLSSAIPCFVLGSSTWPRVTVAHHDADVTFNHSFIEPPSAGWVSENSFSSFETDEEGPVYCIPPKEGDGAEFQEMASKCNIFPDVSSFNAEDVSQAFPIPRTSSIAKSKRPSVSFAEGTKFGPEERRGSATEMFNILRTSKMLWVTSKLSTIQSNTSSLEGEEPSSTEDNHHYEDAEMPDANLNKTDPDKESKSASIGGSGEAQSGRRRTMSNAKRNALPHQAAENTVSVQKSNLEKISTVYVTLGKAVRQSKASSDSSMEGPVQSVLRRLGSLQRQKEDSPKPSGRGDNIIKPPRRKLGARAGLWEQALAASAAKGLPKQKTQVRHSNKLDCSVDSQEGTEVRRPLMSTSILKNTVMSSGGETREKSEMENGDGAVGDQYETHMECSMASNINLSDQGAPSADEKQTLTEDEGPKYENVDPRDIKCASYTTEG
ncbi:scavenger receptor class F member 1 [Polypterus senegalus]|uniref:scavenger receptor class F member 1 n=1 Tax=Polypterus senegalus TaxID=55291 RepID=UPI0019669634|nr:scavenger receptor class F member 1 [Polypterus senegalus]